MSETIKFENMSEKLKTAVIYYSSTGNNFQLAQWAAESAENEGAEEIGRAHV